MGVTFENKYNKNCKTAHKNEKNNERSVNNNKNTAFFINKEKVTIENLEQNFTKKELENIAFSSWVRTYLCVFPSIPNIIKVVDSIVEGRAISCCESAGSVCKINTLAEMEKMIDMGERKKRLFVVYEAIKKVVKKLSPFDRKVAYYKFVDGRKVSELADKLKINVRSLYRRVNKIILSLSVLLKQEKYTIEKFRVNVEKEPWIIYYFDEIYKSQLANMKRRQTKQKLC